PAAGKIRLAQAVDERGRRVVAGEMAGEFGRKMLRRRGARGEIEKDRACLRFALLVVALAHDRAGAGLVQHDSELELARRSSDQPGGGSAAEAAHRPAGQGASEFGDIRLAVAG